MNLLKKIFASSNDNFGQVAWTELCNLEDLEEVLKQSKKETVCIFKHSTRCAVSASVLRKFERNLFTVPKFEKNYYLIKVIECREVSRSLAEQLQVRHESPQLLVVQGRKALMHASHYEILEMDNLAN